MSPERFETAFASPEESPGLLLWQASNCWQRRQRAALKPLGLTHVQFVLLAVLSWLTRDRPGVTQIEIATEAKTDPMMTSQVLRVLAERGLVERLPHPRDPRANFVQVTPAGRDLADRALPIVEQVDRDFFGEFGPDLAASLSAILGRVDLR